MEPNIPAALIAALRAARHLVILTGAGVSAESGLPTFRDPMAGLWAKYRPEDLATPQAFRQNPQLVWDWYVWRRELVAAAAPNPAHYAIAALEKIVPKVTLITQNVDGFHQQAGSTNVFELHGNIRRTKCFDENSVIDAWPATDERPPRCPRCGGLLRPDVVWFGESLPEAPLNAALEATRTCDLFFSIGTSGQVQPAASLPYHALDHGATVAVINLDLTPRETPTLFMIKGPAGVVLPAIVELARQKD